MQSNSYVSSWLQIILSKPLKLKWATSRINNLPVVLFNEDRLVVSDYYELVIFTVFGGNTIDRLCSLLHVVVRNRDDIYKAQCFGRG